MVRLVYSAKPVVHHPVDIVPGRPFKDPRLVRHVVVMLQQGRKRDLGLPCLCRNLAEGSDGPKSATWSVAGGRVAALPISSTRTAEVSDSGAL